MFSLPHFLRLANRRTFVLFAICSLTLLAACSREPAEPTPTINAEPPATPHPAGDVRACPAGPLFDVPPVPISAIDHLGPMGFLSPPGHTFPAQHPGIVVPLLLREDPAAGFVESPLSAPGYIRIVEVHKGRFVREDLGTDITDYGLFFYPCRDVYMYFGHVTSLSDELTALIGPYDEDDCDASIETDVVSLVICSKRVQIDVESGESLGTIGGLTSSGIDFGGTDSRTELTWANPDRGRRHQICPFDYFTQELRDQFQDLFGSFSERRTAEPRCGEIMQDVPGTAQGVWYNYEADVPTEDPHLALVHDHIDPSVGVVSVGTSLPLTVYGAFKFPPQTSGRVNLDFDLVRPGGPILCYEFPDQLWDESLEAFVTLIRLDDEETLQAGLIPGEVCGDPVGWSLPPDAVEFRR